MITITISLLLTAGFFAGKLCQKLRLPSVTGYILAGLILGPTGIELVTETSIGHSLDHFTQIALMLIAFGIGEHIELKKLHQHTKSLMWIGICETSGALIAVSVMVFLTIAATGFGIENWSLRDRIALSLLLGAVGVATAPAATLLVIRELKARGPFTSTLMAIVAIDDGLAIMLFGLVVSVTHQILGHSGEPLLLSIGSGLLEICGSLLLGIITGTLLILLTNRLKESGEIMTAGLAILLLCSEAAVYLHLSPLLAGMAAGFLLVNKAERDVRLFRALNKFEPPIYVLFFTLAGTHLDIDSLRTAGLIGIVYFFSRIGGKILGVMCGARLAGSIPAVRRYLGFAILPQAGVAIGLIFLLSSDDALNQYTAVITPVVLTGVFLSELIGPVSARYALTKAGETNITSLPHSPFSSPFSGSSTHPKGDGDPLSSLVPWNWQKLTPPKTPRGFVVFHGETPQTCRGLARTATILAAHFSALPMAVQVLPPDKRIPQRLFLDEHDEVHQMGYTLATELVPDPDLAGGLITVAEYNEARALVLGYPFEEEQEGFKKMLLTVAHHVNCPVAVIRFYGEMHTERILIPVTDIEELDYMFPIVAAFDSVGEHHLVLLFMMSSTAEQKDVKATVHELERWFENQHHRIKAEIRAVPTESRLEMIIDAANDADLVIMRASEKHGVRRLLFGSLVDSVAKKIRKTFIVVYNTEKLVEE